MMPISHIMNGLAIGLWAIILATKIDHYRQVASAGYSGEWDVWIYIPGVMIIILIICGILFNIVSRRPEYSMMVSMAALVATLPYLVVTGGGM